MTGILVLILESELCLSIIQDSLVYFVEIETEAQSYYGCSDYKYCRCETHTMDPIVNNKWT